MKNKKKYLIIFLFSCALFLNSCGKLQSLVDTAEDALENQINEVETSTQDLTPPSLPTNFTATLTDETITLSWTNPVDLEFAGIAIRYSIQKYPESIIEGNSLYSGTETSFSYEYTQNTTYYFSLFAKDLNSNWTTIPVKFTITTPSLDLGNIDALEEALASANQTIQQAQQTNDDSIFPDQALENAIRTALNKPSGNITESELATITRLTTNSTSANENISNLKGLEYCANLKTLSISNIPSTQLNALPNISALQNLTNLEELIINYAYIQDISSLANLTSLKKLNLEENQISDLTPLKNLTNLEELNLFSNNITDITPLVSLINSPLEWIGLSFNKISISTATSQSRANQETYRQLSDACIAIDTQPQYSY